jgi:hypothetical protein
VSMPVTAGSRPAWRLPRGTARRTSCAHSTGVRPAYQQGKGPQDHHVRHRKSCGSLLAAAGELWRRTKQAIERQLAAVARARGILPVWIPCGNNRHRAIPPVRVSHGKAAEFQARAAVHFHALLRLDGVDPVAPDALIPPPAGITVADLDDAIHQAARTIRFTTAPHPVRPGGWMVAWGDQVDVRVITMRGQNAVTDAMVAAYLAKYSTKGT